MVSVNVPLSPCLVTQYPDADCSIEGEHKAPARHSSQQYLIYTYTSQAASPHFSAINWLVLLLLAWILYLFTLLFVHSGCCPPLWTACSSTTRHFHFMENQCPSSCWEAPTTEGTCSTVMDNLHNECTGMQERYQFKPLLFITSSSSTCSLLSSHLQGEFNL